MLVSRAAASWLEDSILRHDMKWNCNILVMLPRNVLVVLLAQCLGRLNAESIRAFRVPERTGFHQGSHGGWLELVQR